MHSFPRSWTLLWKMILSILCILMLDYPPVGRRKSLPDFWGGGVLAFLQISWKGESCFFLGFLGWICGPFIPFGSSQFSHVIYRWVITNYIGTQPSIALHSLAQPKPFSFCVLECSISWVILKHSWVVLKSSWVRLKVSQGILKSIQWSQCWVIAVAINSSSAESSTCWVISLLNGNSVTFGYIRPAVLTGVP